MKEIRRILTTILCMLFATVCMGQNRKELEALYQQQMGNAAGLFIGKLEVPYSTKAYKTQPYLIEEGVFKKGSICQDRMVYNDVPLRFDIYQNILIVETPEQHLWVMTKKESISFFTLEGHKYVNLNGTFVREEYAGKKLSLYTHLYLEQGIPDMQQAVKLIQFNSKSAMWLVDDGKVKTIKNRKDLEGLFPAHKQEIKQYVKNNRLKFNSKHRTASIQSLVQLLDK